MLILILIITFSKFLTLINYFEILQLAIADLHAGSGFW